MLDSSLIVAAIGANRARQGRHWAAPARRTRARRSAAQDAHTPATNPDNTATEQVLTETTPRK